ncbi:MAG: hypothetical protein MHM6MM_002036 [Cercozoa sp. M6MM]
MRRALSTYSGDDAERALRKATFADDDVPKEKHVQLLISLVNSHGSTKLAELLARRLRAQQRWEPVLKTLVVLHRLMREANAGPAQRLAQRLLSQHAHVFDLASFLDKKDTMAWGQSTFIRLYGSYLHEKTLSVATLGYDVPERLKRSRAATLREWQTTNSHALSEMAPLLLAQLNAIVKCEMYQQEGRVASAVSAMLLMLKDAMPLFAAVSTLSLNVLQSYKRMRASQLRASLPLCTSFAALVAAFREWASQLIRTGIVRQDMLPEFCALPESTLEQMQAHLDDLERGDHHDSDRSDHDDDHCDDRYCDHFDDQNESLRDVLGADVHVDVHADSDDDFDPRAISTSNNTATGTSSTLNQHKDVTVDDFFDDFLSS